MSVLKDLEVANVVAVRESRGRAVFLDGNEMEYSLTLSKADLIELARELTQLAERVE